MGFRTPSAEFQTPKPRIPDSTSKNFPIPDSGSKNVTGSGIWVPFRMHSLCIPQEGKGRIVQISEGRKRGCQFFLKQLINHFTSKFSYFLVQ